MPNLRLSPMEDLYGHVLDWLTANGIDPSRIPAEPHMTLVGDQLTTDQKVQNDRGRDQIDPSDPTAIAREVVTYTITVPPPPDVATWLLPRCPTCGR
jgi:hypothetical protein